ncbi:MAG: hypothetical protein SF002_02185 [Alphaproteobacteria bacterium]|nr:hypothetical protein [Alphaproteobacteria bacterium]
METELRDDGFHIAEESLISEWGEFEARQQQKEEFLLPFVIILETGHHVAQLRDGGHRFQSAKVFVTAVTAAMDGHAPFQATRFPEATTVRTLLSPFPENAKREVSLGDLSIIEEWRDVCARHRRRRVMIWSLDQHLSGYNFTPPPHSPR